MSLTRLLVVCGPAFLAAAAFADDVVPNDGGFDGGVVTAWPGPSYNPEHVMVRFAPGTSRQEAADTAAKHGSLGIVFEYDLIPGLYCVRVAPGTVVQAINGLLAEPSVSYAEPDFERHILSQTTPYGASLVQAPGVWASGRGGGAKVAVLDTGVDTQHPDLITPVLMTTFVPGEAVEDLNTHGTHCSGIVLARDNDIGVVGCAPSASLMIGKVLGNSGSGDDSGVLAGVNWAVSNGANVISMSLGGAGYSQSFADACVAAVNANVLVVAAAGNDNSSNPSYPGAYPAVMSIAAVDQNSARASFSNFGPTISVSAPGVSCLSTVPVITGNARWSSTDHAATSLSGSAFGSASGQAIYCGQGLAPSDFPPSVAGNIAHIRRGGGTFQAKAQNAVNAGAVGVIISNNVAGSYSGTLNQSFNVVVVGISQADGDTLQAASGVQTAISIARTGHDYASYSGTSMATPHVAGVAAALISAFPPGRVSAAQLRAALENTATDLGDPGRDDYYGHGLVNAQAALTYLRGVISPACVADMDNGSGTGTPDGGVTIDDLLYYLGQFNAGNIRADVDNGSGTGTRDGGVTIDDLLYFLQRFNAGC